MQTDDMNHRDIVMATLSLVKSHLGFSAEMHQLFKNLFSAAGLDSDDMASFDEATDSLPLPKKIEGKTLLMDILMLAILSREEFGKSSIADLAKVMDHIRLSHRDYIVFPLYISFEELAKKQAFNSDNLFRMLHTKVFHCVRNKIYLPYWSESMRCYNQKVDQQHKYIIQRFTDYIMKVGSAGSMNEIKKMLKILQSYSVSHFKTEETFMENANYPLLDDHRKTHKRFVAIYKSMLVDYQIDRNIDKLKGTISDLLNWFLTHIRTMDIKAGFFMKVKKYSSVRKNRMLICFGDDADREKLESILMDIGFDNVVASQTEKDCYEWVTTGDFAACFLCSKQQTLSGVSLLEKIRGNSLDIPVVMISTTKNVNDLKKTIQKNRLKHANNRILTYPLQPEQLIAALNQLVFSSEA
ncbi:MAG: hypothetical protein MJE63_09025 [Proteobacteria bacterium]|nr:hypothetical protein [Pseudomonadota bacterium]